MGDIDSFLNGITGFSSTEYIGRLIGQKIDVLKLVSEWQKMVSNIDRIEITNVTGNYDFENSEWSQIMVRADCWLDGKLKYNCWFPVSSIIQMRICHKNSIKDKS